jgi:hypothetical protein
VWVVEELESGEQEADEEDEVELWYNNDRIVDFSEWPEEFF